MFIAMNNFQVNPERAAEFEQNWRDRESYLDTFDGFVSFHLLKGDEPGQYASHTVWRSRADFMKWVQSDAFRSAHSQRTPEGVLVGHPRAHFFESVLEQFPKALATA